MNTKGPLGITALIAAVCHGHTDAAGRLLKAGADAGCADSSGISVLVYACDNGDAAMARLLIAAGAACRAGQ